MKKDYRLDAKTLLFDLEVSPTRGWFYGQYEVNPIKIEQPPILLSVAWKWLGDNGAPKCKTLGDYKSSGTYDDRLLVKELWDLLDKAEIVVAHNGKRFDDKMANTFFLRHNMKPPKPYKVYDTLQVAKKYFKIDNNKLDYVDKLLGGNGKTDITYADCWDDLLHGDKKTRKKAAKLMAEYNKQDVVALENIYNKLLPWATIHPNMALAAGVDFICPRCGHDAEFRVRAYRKTGAQVNAVQVQCQHCGAYVTRPLSPEEKEEMAELGKLKSLYRNLSA